MSDSTLHAPSASFEAPASIEIGNRLGALGNWRNWLALLRVCYVFVNPLRFAWSFLRGRAPDSVVVRTPTGSLRVALRNLESLKTLFSIFCRQDYFTPASRPCVLLDVGANVGIASLYFLSRNRATTVWCYEPDLQNLDHLKRNLAPFADRVRIFACAIGTQMSTMTLYRSEDGKYSSLIPSRLAMHPQSVTVHRFDSVLRAASAGGLPLVVKLDVEGLEEDLIRSVRFENHPEVVRLTCESTECARWITRPHERIVRSGYVEDLSFEK